MRRTLAAAILGISLWIGSLAWSGFLLTKTVLDPGRSEDVAGALYDDEQVRDRLAENMAGAIGASLPPGVEVDQAVLDEAARTALASPVVEVAIRDALVASHQAFLGEGTAPGSIDAGAFGAASRDALVAARPELATVIPPAPAFQVPLPTDRIPNLGPVRRVLEAVVPLLALAAAAGALLALVVTKNRPAILRRAGFWAIGLSAVVLAFAYGLPALAERFTPDQSEVVAALIGAMVAQTRTPAIVLAVAGVGGIIASFVWRATPAVLGMIDTDPPVTRPSRPDGPPTGMNASQAARWYQRRDIPPPRRPARDPSIPTVVREPDGFSTRARPPVPDPHPGYPDGPAPPTRVTSVVPPTAESPDSVLAPRAGAAEPARRVIDSAEEIPDDARWVPGVGYVVEET